MSVAFMIEPNIKSQPKISKRFSATLIDYTPQFIFFFWYIYNFGEPNDEGGYSVEGLKATVPIIFWFVLLVIPEALSGKSLGKLVVGLKVVNAKNGESISMIQGIKRRLLDPIDLFITFGIVAYLNIKNTPQNQRLGDLWSKTIVVGGEETICTECAYQVNLEPDEVVKGKFICPNCNKEISNHII